MKKSIQTLLAVTSASMILVGRVAHAEVMNFETEEEAYTYVTEEIGGDLVEKRDFTLMQDDAGQWVLTYGPEFEATRGDVKLRVVDIDGQPVEGAQVELTAEGDFLQDVTDAEGYILFENLDPNLEYMARMVDTPQELGLGTEYLQAITAVAGETQEVTFGEAPNADPHPDQSDLEDLVFDTPEEANEAGWQAYKDSEEFNRYRIDKNVDGKWYFTLENELTEDNESGFTNLEDAHRVATDLVEKSDEFSRYALKQVDGKWYYELSNELIEDNETGFTFYEDAVEQAEAALKAEPTYVDYTVEETNGKFYYTLYDNAEEASSAREQANTSAGKQEQAPEESQAESSVEVTSQAASQEVKSTDEKGKLPDTGENSSIGVILLGLLAAVAGFVVLALPRLKNKAKE